MSVQFAGSSLALSKAGLQTSSQKIAVGEAEIWTVLAVETSGCGFLADRRPQILFERHIFHRLTGGRFDDGDISSPTPGGYGPGGANQFDRLARAVALDREAALKSASWGMGQIMGQNFALAGFSDVESMVAAMMESEDAQLDAVVSFLSNSKIAPLLSSHTWAGFAARYNGPSFASNQYDTKLANAFAKYSTGTMPDIDIRAAQLYLTFHGENPGPIDGMHGARTSAAIINFQRQRNLPETGVLDEMLLEILIKELTAN